jgi:DNA-directed RNA polymerase specialized sigma24 family protein
MDNDTAARRQMLQYFYPDDRAYYDSHQFRTTIVQKVFGDQVRRKIAAIIGIPYGLIREDPDVDDLYDETFDMVRKYLNAALIAGRPTPDYRYATCGSFVLTIASNRAISFKTKNPYVWKHGDLSDDLHGKHPVTENEYMSYEAAELADLEEQANEDAARQRVRDVLCTKISEEELEILWLFAVRGWDVRELQTLLGKSYAATRMQVYRLRIKAREVLNDPEVLRHLFAEDGLDEAHSGEDHSGEGHNEDGK